MAHMHYKGTGKVHSFRGLLEHLGQDKILVQGPVGAIAWRITKFEVMGYDPSASNHEGVIKIYREEQSSVTDTIDFTQNELLGAAIWTMASALVTYPINEAVIFDNALFSRNIWVTHADKSAGTNSANYYIELEEVKVSKAAMAQLALAASRRVQTDV
jgi:hypothetical protein